MSKMRISCRSSKIRGRLVTKKPVTMATKIMAILSSAFLLLALQLWVTGVPGAGAGAELAGAPGASLLRDKQDDAEVSWVVVDWVVADRWLQK